VSGQKRLPKPVTVLAIRPVPDGPDTIGRDPVYRLKVLLKRMLRSYGWKLVDICTQNSADSDCSPLDALRVIETPKPTRESANGGETPQRGCNAEQTPSQRT
jgi:hypothetical protein